MKLVQTSDQGGHDECDARPLDGPAPSLDKRNSGAPGAVEKEAQSEISAYVTGLADVEVPHLESCWSDIEDEMQNWIKEPAGVTGREPVGRLDGDEDKPQNRCDPGLPDLMRAGILN